MRKKAVFITMVFLMLVVMNKVYATEERISQEVIEESRNIESTEVNRETAVILLSEEVTVVETWDISATTDDSVAATLYSDGTIIISGNGNMKDYSDPKQCDWYDYRENILKVIVKSGVNNIGNNAFGYYYQNIEIVEIEEGLLKIGTNTFYECIKLNEINFPNSLEMIPYLAFADCESLESIRLPGSLKKIGQKSFMGCGALKEVYIEEGLEEILKDTFSDCTNLNKVTLPNSLISIDEYVFYNCDIKEITIPANVTNISKSAFNGCNNLTNIYVYRNSYAEEYVKENYNDKLNVIDIMETWDISATEEDSVEATLYNNGTLIISGTGNMKDYSTINIENSEYSPWYDNRNNITSVHIENGVNNIGNAAFFDCRQLINITIPEGVTNIGEYAFRYCNSLNKIVLPTSVSSIGVSAFMDCSSLSHIRIPDKVTNISRGLFYNCNSLENINIPEGITVIGRNAFGKCSSLTSITIPASVTTIEEYPFNLCNKLTSINVDEKNSFYISDGGVLFNKDKTKLICYPANKSDIKEYIVPNTVKSIEAYSFTCCSNLKNIIIQEGTTHIGAATFYNCSSLTNITIPESVTNIENGILSNCVNLKNINVYCNSYVEEYVTQNYADKLNIIHTEVIDKGITPTCTLAGLTEGKHCSVCEKVLIAQEEVVALGHNYSEWSVTKDATCEEEGTKERTCTVCQNKEIGVVEVLGHSYSTEWTEDVAPTCTEVGSKSHHCTRENCDSKIDVTEVPVIAHSYGEWVVTKDATCTETGSKEKVCSVCQNKETEVITKLGHEYNVIVTNPTCTEKGYTTHICTKCSDNYIDTKTDTLGHNFGVWVIDKEATYEEEGHKYRVCTNCNTEKEEQVILNLINQELEVQTTYTVKEQEGQKFVVMPSAEEVQEILSNITSNKDLEIVDKSGNIIEDTTKVGTGAKVVEKQSREVAYTIVVKGDANGDAKIDFINDIIGFNNYRLNIIKLDTASILAGDINEDGKINFITDIIGINNYRLGIINSL